MSLVCGRCLRRQLTALRPAHRRYAKVSIFDDPTHPINQPSSGPKPSPPAKERNAHSLRDRIETILAFKNPERAEETLKHSRLPDSQYSWNLLIKYLAHEYKVAETERIYQQVTPIFPGVKPVFSNFYDR
jgi:hypothetical protein